MKYTKESLTRVAQRVLEAREQGDRRYRELIARVALLTLTPVDQVVARIEAMSQGEFQ